MTSADTQPLVESSEPPLARQQGFVLLVVLWVITSAVLLVASFNAAVRSGAASAVSEIGLTKSRALLDAGVEIAAAHLIDQDETRRWVGNGSKHPVAFGGAELTIAVTDSNGLIDLNKSDEKLLRAFFQKFTKSGQKAAQYTAFILQARAEASGDKAKQNLQQVNDALTGASPGVPSQSPAFIDVSQLGRSKGMSHDVFDRIAPFLTVYSRDGTINPVAAPAEVLEAVPDLNRADIEKIKYADKAALSDIMQKGQSYLTDQSGPAYLVTVKARRPDDDYSISRTYAIATGLDQSAPYRLITKWPVASTVAEKAR